MFKFSRAFQISTHPLKPFTEKTARHPKNTDCRCDPQRILKHSAFAQTPIQRRADIVMFLVGKCDPLYLVCAIDIIFNDLSIVREMRQVLVPDLVTFARTFGLFAWILMNGFQQM